MNKRESLEFTRLHGTPSRRAFLTTIAGVSHHSFHVVVEGIHVTVSGSSVPANLNMAFPPILRILGHFGTPNIFGASPKDLCQMCTSWPFPILLIFDKTFKDGFCGLHLGPTTSAKVWGKILAVGILTIMVQSCTTSFEKLFCPNLGTYFEAVAPLERDVRLAIVSVPALYKSENERQE